MKKNASLNGWTVEAVKGGWVKLTRTNYTDKGRFPKAGQRVVVQEERET